EDRRRGLDEFAAKPLGKMHPLALYIRAGSLPQFQRLGIVAELNSDLFQDRIGIGLDKRQALLIQNLIERHLAPDIGHLLTRAAAGARRPAGGGAAALASSAP